jgi:hypothetical protein
VGAVPAGEFHGLAGAVVLGGQERAEVLQPVVEDEGLWCWCGLRLGCFDGLFGTAMHNKFLMLHHQPLGIVNPRIRHFLLNPLQPPVHALPPHLLRNPQPLPLRQFPLQNAIQMHTPEIVRRIFMLLLVELVFAEYSAQAQASRFGDYRIGLFLGED